MERVKRRWWTRLVTLAASLVIAAALLSGLFQLAILALPGYRQDIADYVSRAAGRPVEIGGVSLSWSGLAPKLELTDLAIYPESARSNPVSVQTLTLGFSVARLVRGEWMPSRLAVSGLQLVALIDSSGQIRLRGFDTPDAVSAGRTDWLRDLERFEVLELSNCDLSLIDQRLSGVTLSLKIIEASARRTDEGALLKAQFRPPHSPQAVLSVEARLLGSPTTPSSLSGDWTLSLEGYSGTPWLGRAAPSDLALQLVEAGVSASGKITGGQLGPSQLRLSARSLKGARGEQQAELSDLVVDAELEPLADGWQVDIQELAMNGARGAWPQTTARARIRQDDKGRWEVDGDIDFLRLDDLLPFAGLADPPWLRRLRGFSGDLHDLILRYTGSGGGMVPQAVAELMPGAPVAPGPSTPGLAHSYLLRARLEGLALPSDPQFPGFRGLSGQIVATDAGGKLSLAEGLQDGGFELRFDPLFDTTVNFEALSGSLIWSRGAEHWQVDMPDFRWAFAGSQGKGKMRLQVPDLTGTSPVLSLSADFSSADLTRLKPYVPKLLGDSLRGWLNRAVEAGRVSAGRLLIEGPIEAFPFVDGSGVFELDIEVQDGRLAYLKTWPVMDQASASVRFRGNSLGVQVSEGRVLGNRVERFSAQIDDLTEALLQVDGVIRGEAADLYAFLGASPLADQLSVLLTQTRAEGEAQVNLRVEAPIRDDAIAEIDGEILLANNSLIYQRLDEPITNINGSLRFYNDGLEAENLRATLAGLELTAGLRRQGEGVSLLEVRTRFAPDPAGAGLSRYIPGWILSHLSGAGELFAELEIGRADPALLLSSDLVGIGLDLPEPFAKRPEQARAFALAISGDEQVPLRVELAYADQLEGELRFAGQQEIPALERGLLRLGGESPPEPDRPGLWIDGRLASADLGAWIGLFATGGEGESPLAGLDLEIGQLQIAGQSTAALSLSLRPEAGGLVANLSGEGAQGQVRWQPAEGGRVEARLASLKLDTPARTTDPQTLPPEPAAAGAAVGDPIDPAQWPVFDLRIERFDAGSAKLGRLEARTLRMDGGQSIETLTASGAELQLDVTGHWRRLEGRSDARLQAEGSSRSIGPLLEGLGYARNLDARSTGFKADLEWPEALGVDWTQAQGTLRFDVEDGSLRAVEPGAGRVLGLMNFYALPRRLSLDFSDVVDKGLGFDEIQGEFTIADGIAHTSGVEIDATSLSIRVRGNVDLVRKTYDQRVTVYPDVSGGVTLGALLLGGPAAGLVALIAQQVLDKPLDQVTQFSYQVTGPWDSPEVDRAGSETSEPPAPAARP